MEQTGTQPLRSDGWPEPSPIADPAFTWGDGDGAMFTAKINNAYREITHWKPNLFPVPFGSVGKCFVSELARLYRAFATASALEGIALKAASVMTALVLQRPYTHSKTKLHVKCLQKRIELWCKGLIEELLVEGKTIQARTFKSNTTHRPKGKTSSMSRSFAKLMFQGKCNSAFRLLSDEENSGGVLNEDDKLPSGETVFDVLCEKHPKAQGPSQEATLAQPIPPTTPNPVIFDRVDADLIRHAAKQTRGSAGPSGLNAHAWRKLCCSFSEASNDLCNAMAAVARRLCTQHVHPSTIAPLLACRPLVSGP